MLVHPSSFDWLRARFGISLIYVDHVLTDLIWPKVGNACFPRYDDVGKVVGIGSYSTSPMKMDEID